MMVSTLQFLNNFNLNEIKCIVLKKTASWYIVYRLCPLFPISKQFQCSSNLNGVWSTSTQTHVKTLLKQIPIRRRYNLGKLYQPGIRFRSLKFESKLGEHDIVSKLSNTYADTCNHFEINQFYNVRNLPSNHCLKVHQNILRTTLCVHRLNQQRSRHTVLTKSCQQLFLFRETRQQQYRLAVFL